MMCKFFLFILSFCFSILFQNDPIKIGANQFACPYCTKLMKHRATMERHILIHTGHKPFSCPYCPKGFSQKSDLERHITLHTGEKPFACTICHYSATRKDLLTNHIQSKHSDDYK